MGQRYRTKVITNIIYSTIVTCLIEVFLVINLNMLGSYAEETGYRDSILVLFGSGNTMITLLYVLFGIGTFAVTFLLLQEKSMKYIAQISAAMRNVSEGDLNTSVDVIGDDEFSEMAENLNNMVAEIRVLMDKEREAERTKNELITNVAHDLRTPLTSIIGYLELLSRSGTDSIRHAEKIHLHYLYESKASGEADRRPVWLYQT